MTQEDIIRMAREADLIDDTYASDWYVYQLRQFAALVAEAATEAANARANTSWTLMCKKMVAAENEACAKVCDEQENRSTASMLKAKGVKVRDIYSAAAQTAHWNAAAIRARGNT